MTASRGDSSPKAVPPLHEDNMGDAPGVAERLRVLIVEDNPADAVLAEGAIKRSGRWRAEFVRALTLEAAEALLLREGSNFDLILLDMRLPDADGAHSLQRLLSARPGIAVLVLTGVDSEELARECLEAGALDYVAKDAVLSREFVRAIGYVLARSHNIQLNARLEQVDRLAALGEMAAGIAHEINNPATYVRYAVADVQERLTSLRTDLDQSQSGLAVPLDQLVADLDAATLGIDRIATVVRDLGDYARERTTIDGIIDDPVSLCRSSLKLVDHQVRHCAGLELDLKPCPPIKINPQRFAQVLTNLVLNAVQAQAQHGSSEPIRVGLGPSQGGVELRVEDSGGGVDPGLVEKIFKSFFTTKSDRGGSGLGLAICRRLMNAAGGTLTLESRPGEGSTFLAWFATSDERCSGRTEQVIPFRRVDRAKILLVEDDTLVREALARGLGRKHEVLAVEGGAEALRLLSELGGQVDILLCDLMMPGMDGAETLTRVFAGFPQLRERTFVLSGGATTEETARFVVDSGLEVLEKPLPLRTLVAAVDTRLWDLAGDS